MKSNPRAVPQKKVFLIDFHLAGKYKEHLIKIMELLPIKSKILLYSC